MEISGSDAAGRSAGSSGIDWRKSKVNSVPLPGCGADGDMSPVGLDDAIDDGEAEAGSTFKAGLKGLEDLFDELRRDAGPGVLKTDAPVALKLVERDGEGSAVGHGADGIAAEIPENLLEFVAVAFGQGHGMGEAALDGDGGRAVFQQRQGVREKLAEIDAWCSETCGLASR